MSEVRCKNPYCKRLIEQAPGGHRKREYCDDVCRQTAHRYRREQKERERLQAEMRARWTGLLSETQQVLEDVLQSHGPTLASRVAVAVRAEVSHAKAEREQHSAGQEDHQNVEVYQEKLTQASHRIEKLERQVDIQRQRLGQYYQWFYPSSLAVAEERLLALGAAVNYKRLLKYNELTIDSGSGAEAWRNFATHADYDALALAIQQAQRFYENLEATHASPKRDLPASHE